VSKLITTVLDSANVEIALPGGGMIRIRGAAAITFVVTVGLKPPAAILVYVVFG
jgi:hypothetical protein